MIHTRRFGGPGGLPSLLVHCFLGHSGAWAPMADLIAPRLDALAFDMPGHGRTPMPPHVGDLQAEVANLIDGFVTKPSLLIGHSFGAVSLMRFALHNPGRVLGLVLIEPVFIAAALADPEFEPAPGDADYAIAAQEGRYEDAARQFFSFNDPSRDWNALPAAARAQMTAQMQLLPATEPGAIKDSGRLLTPGLMEGFAPPVLLIGGARSPALFPAIIKALGERFTDARRVEIEGAGHMVPLTHARQTADAINCWLRDTGMATAA